MLCFTVNASAQHQVEYAYDAAGNRIGRVSTTLRLAVTPPARVSQQPVDTVPPSVVPAGELGGSTPYLNPRTGFYYQGGSRPVSNPRFTMWDVVAPMLSLGSISLFFIF